MGSFSRNYLKPPRYWHARLGLGTLWLIHLLPYRTQLFLGRRLGMLYKYISGRRRYIAQRNLDLCFPDLSKADRRILLDNHFEAVGMALIENALCWWGSKEQMASLTAIDGAEHLERALQSGSGVILLTGHMTTLEIGVRVLAACFDTATMYRPMKNKFMDRFVSNARNHYAAEALVFPRENVRAMVNFLKEGKAVWYGFDQDYGPGHSLFVPFFITLAATITATSRFARISGAQVVPFFPYRLKDGHYRIEIQPPLENFPSDDLAGDTRRLNELLEQAILKAPEQYLWIHRRFKTRPKGEPYLYQGEN